jgi:hypothetical protein
LHYWGIGLKKDNSFQLLVSASSEPGLELLNQTIRITFALECPSRIDDIHIILAINHFPCID